ncbi:MAG: hypothetical protein Q9172_004970 [Xanthocarpia lactea]
MAVHAGVKLLPVEDLYAGWAGGYDQGQVNNMQGLDDVQLETFLPKFLLLTHEAHSGSTNLKIVDFGCGTGRTTLKLLKLPSATIVGLDATPQLIELARHKSAERLTSLPQDARAAEVQYEVYNPLIHPQAPECAQNAHGLISTLALEHFALPDFFKATSPLVQTGSYLMVTDLHPDLARIANYTLIDEKSGELMWTASHIHSIDDVRAEAPKWGLEVVEVQEGSPKDPKMVGAMRGNWEGVKCWVGYILKKK